MSRENENVFRRLIEEGFSKGNLAALDELFAPDFVEHQDGFTPPNIEGVKAAIVSLRTPFPDLRLTVEEIIASGDRTWARTRSRPAPGALHGTATHGQVLRHHRHRHLPVREWQDRRALGSRRPV